MVATLFRPSGNNSPNADAFKIAGQEISSALVEQGKASATVCVMNSLQYQNYLTNSAKPHINSPKPV